jgi:putative membrane protein
MNTKGGAFTAVSMWLLISLYGGARVLQILPGKLPLAAIIALHVLPLVLFTLIHGTMSYRLRGILVFFTICLVVGNVFENLGVATGFPFGRYHFTDAMGPKLFQVPILLGLAYVGMGYLSWTLGRIILGNLRSPLVGARIVTLPLVAAFPMVAWDFANDPVWANINHLWVWQRGGAYFGVPLTNFLGWYFVVYLIYQSFAVYLRRCSLSANPRASGYWRWAVSFYAMAALGNIILVLPKPEPAVVFDSTGILWNVTTITGACALVSIFVMGAFAVIAGVRLSDEPRETTQTRQ